MDVKEFFARNPLFNREEWLTFRYSCGKTQKSASQLLRYYYTRKRLVQVHNGLFAVVIPGTDAEIVDTDPFDICMKVASDAVVAYHAALEFHGYAHSHFQDYPILVERQFGYFDFHGMTFHSTMYPKALCRKQEWQTEILNQEREMQTIRVTSMERTLVDCLDRVSLAGGWEELWRSMTALRHYDLDRVIAYAGKLDNAIAAARVGFFLEQNKKALHVPESILRKLELLRPRQNLYLDTTRTPGKVVKRWKLVVPPEILNQAWGTVE